jgi:hypothetical protein
MAKLIRLVFKIIILVGRLHAFLTFMRRYRVFVPLVSGIDYSTVEGDRCCWGVIVDPFIYC